MAERHYEPQAWRTLSGPQRKMLRLLVEVGPQVVVAQTRRTCIVLARGGYLEHADYGRQLPVREGQVVRASGKALDVYRQMQRMQGKGLAFVKRADLPEVFASGALKAEV